MIEHTVLESIIAAIPLTDSVSHIIPLAEGFSTDEKFVIYRNGLPIFLMRISNAQESEQRRNEYSLLTQLAAGGILCPKPYYFAELPEFGICVAILEYIPGENAEDSLAQQTLEMQYAIGQKAGETLRQIHSALLVPRNINWATSRLAKYHRLLALARERQLCFTAQNMVENLRGFASVSHAGTSC